MDQNERTLWLVGGLGVLVALGKLLAADKPVKLRQAAGVAITNGVLTLSSFAALAWIPDASPTLLVGIAALVGSLGTSGLTMMASKFSGGKITISGGK